MTPALNTGRRISATQVRILLFPWTGGGVVYRYALRAEDVHSVSQVRILPCPVVRRNCERGLKRVKESIFKD